MQVNVLTALQRFECAPELHQFRNSATGQLMLLNMQLEEPVLVVATMISYSIGAHLTVIVKMRL